MQTINTILGQVTVSNVSMSRSSGYGQYTISIELEFEGNKKTVNVHSTDSQLWDTLTDLDGNKSDYLMNDQKYLIEREVEDYINSL